MKTNSCNASTRGEVSNALCKNILQTNKRAESISFLTKDNECLLTPPNETPSFTTADPFLTPDIKSSTTSSGSCTNSLTTTLTNSLTTIISDDESFYNYNREDDPPTQSIDQSLHSGSVASYESGEIVVGMGQWANTINKSTNNAQSTQDRFHSEKNSILRSSFPSNKTFSMKINAATRPEWKKSKSCPKMNSSPEFLLEIDDAMIENIEMSSKTMASSSESEEHRKRISRLGINLFAMSFFFVCLSFGAMLSRRNKEPIETTDLSGFDSSELELEFFSISDPSLLADPSTPQSKAVMWVNHNQPESPRFLSQNYILAVFYYSLSSPLWDYHSNNWLSSSPICSWNGISCTTDGMIRSLNLPAFKLKGTIPADSLNLSHNYIHGGLPSNITAMSQLESLDTSHNLLRGKLPSTFHTMHSLSYLDLSQNTFDGYIPDSISNIPNLNRLYLHNNLFSGTLPLSFSKLKYLEVLSIQNNLLIGELSINMFYFDHHSKKSSPQRSSFLSFLTLSHNQFFGTLPEELSNILPNLQILKLDHNAFDGSIPSSYAKFTNLIDFSIEYNNISGVVPLGMCDIPSLIVFTAECANDTNTPKISCDCCTTCYNSIH